MNMHVFEYLTMLGWCIFVIESDPEATSRHYKTPVWRRSLDGFLFCYLAAAATSMGAPTYYAPQLVPTWMEEKVQALDDFNYYHLKKFFEPIGHLRGHYQGVWDMFGAKV
jgi:hypothetical protein